MVGERLRHKQLITKLPKVVVHADWSTQANKRWVATALMDGPTYTICQPSQLTDPGRFVPDIIHQAGPGSSLIGFDFPIGIPESYARLAGICRFPDFLRRLAQPEWRDFFRVAEQPADISSRRPFYPARPGGTRQQFLLDALGIKAMEQLLRQCELPHGTRQAASPLFWTMGAKQVGKAAIAGWRDILLPMVLLEPSPIRIWPFDGTLRHLLSTGYCVVAETYPAEACLHLGFDPPGRGWSKRNQADRRSKAELIQMWAERRAVRLEPMLTGAMKNGFGSSATGEDAFDSLIGLCSMLEIVLGHRGDGAPESQAVQDIEGWILGQFGATSRQS